MHRKPISEVCSAIGKTCSGPVDFYITDNRQVGISLNIPLTLKEAEESEEVSKIELSPEFGDIIKDLKYRIVGKKILVPSEYDLGMEAPLIVNGKEYAVKKLQVQTQFGTVPDKFVYIIDTPDPQAILNPLLSALAVAVSAAKKEKEDEQKAEEEVPAPAEEGMPSPDLGMGEPSPFGM